MPKISINGQEVDIDIEDEIGQFPWLRPRWSSEKLIAASPFRYDKTPSFFVNLETGGWHDSGAYDIEYESGNLPKLLAFLRDETYEETCDYLIELYGVRDEDRSGDVTIAPITLKKPETRISIDEVTLSPYRFRHKYLGRRGISERVQRFMGVGYSKTDKAVTMPWRHPDGSLANVKYRKVYGKVFWYERGAAPVRNLVYGIDKVYKHRLTRVVVCEAEIDALSWMTAGMPAIALGGTTVTDKQLDIIRKSPVESIVLAPDNDKPGDKMVRKLTDGLRGHMAIEIVKIPAKHKDANEALVAGVELSELWTSYLHDLFDWNV